MATEFEDQARTELAAAMVLAPEDLLADIGALGQLLYLEQLAWHVFRSMTGMLSSDASTELASDDPPVISFQQLAVAVGEIDQACVTMGILPEAAQYKE